MTIRTHLALAFLSAPCMLAAAATNVAAGPLPLEVLGPMRTRTVKLIEDAQRQVKSLQEQELAAFETFVKETSSPRALQPGNYEKLLGNYFQQSAEIGAQKAAQEAIGAALSSHLAQIDQQIQAWKFNGLSDDEVTARLMSAGSTRPHTAQTPRPSSFPPSE